MARVLVVEGDFDAREAIAARLREAEHRVVTAHDATAALAMVKQIGNPDVYVVDVGLPSMDGFEFVRRATDGDRSVPAVYLTRRSAVRRLSPHTGETFLTKPVPTRELLDTIQTVIERKVAEFGELESGW
jgi:DNA-binding response OmpR family regulator